MSAADAVPFNPTNKSAHCLPRHRSVTAFRRLNIAVPDRTDFLTGPIALFVSCFISGWQIYSHTHQQGTSLALWYCTVRPGTLAHCRLCPGPWWQTLTRALRVCWSRSLPPEPAACSRPAPRGRGAWWRGCLPCPRRWWRWSWRPPPWARTSPSPRLCPHQSAAGGGKNGKDHEVSRVWWHEGLPANSTAVFVKSNLGSMPFAKKSN